MRSGKIFAYLRLVRFPDIFTAIADVLAGYLIASGPHIEWPEIAHLLLSTSAIYAGGCVLNDLLDKKIDEKERPDRPIPSGMVSVREAFLLACTLFVIGLFNALRVNVAAFLAALLLFLLVISYDALTKRRKLLGPLTMGACRAVNLVFGMVPSLVLTGVPLVLSLVSLVYVFSLTRLRMHAVLDTKIGKAVRIMVLGIPLIDAAYVSGIRGWAYGIPVAFCVVPMLSLSRYFRCSS